MKTRLEERLAQLRQEFESGQQQLAALDERAAKLRETLLRISGAIQVLEEELGRPEAPADAPEATLATPGHDGPPDAAA